MVRSLAPLVSVVGLGVSVLLSACADTDPIYEQACPIPIGSAPRRGPDDAWVTIVEFADFQCSYCQDVESTIRQVDAAHQGLRWVFKHFPLTEIHPNATAAASAADCAHQQGQFWPLHDKLYSVRGISESDTSLRGYAQNLALDMDAWNACFKSSASLDRLSSDIQQGKANGVGGTPTFFINGDVLAGDYPVGDFLKLIGEVENEAKKSAIAKAEYYDSLLAADCGQ